MLKRTMRAEIKKDENGDNIWDIDIEDNRDTPAQAEILIKAVSFERGSIIHVYEEIE
jgi:hypothetical protein